MKRFAGIFSILLALTSLTACIPQTDREVIWLRTHENGCAALELDLRAGQTLSMNILNTSPRIVQVEIRPIRSSTVQRQTRVLPGFNVQAEWTARIDGRYELVCQALTGLP